MNPLTKVNGNTYYLKQLSPIAWLAEYCNRRTVNLRLGLVLIIDTNGVQQRTPVNNEEDAISKLYKLEVGC